MREVTQALLELLERGGEGALATVIETSGSTPQVPGARLLLRAGGSSVGTIGGGAIERRVLDALQEVLASGRARVLGCDLGKELGMCCGGRMKLFLEPIAARPRLIVFGAGHVAQPTAALALGVGFEVVVVDEREEWNTAQRFPGCQRELSDVRAALRALAPARRDRLLIVTHDHQLDEEVLRLGLLGAAGYIGLVGSRRKVLRLLERVTARLGPVELERVYAPVGLNLGAVTPQEIAVSVVAELIAHARGISSPGPLRTTSGAPGAAPAAAPPSEGDQRSAAELLHSPRGEEAG